MAIVQVTSREFRDKQASLFDLADKGERIIIRRGKKRAYLLTPIENDDLFFTDKMLSKIDASLEQVKKGEIIEFESVEDAIKHFEDAV
ncbi:MAG: hypothetical protein XD81_1280 [Bacteroidetes bacterium 38_7]|jgi:antitoxin (DNA-binding transcriptional repressor) of toxin-antitoxin stability system|nr:MAG: hypothetical protein XD81_1280 [Bacteroidetes bacterium 38_7]